MHPPNENKLFTAEIEYYHAILTAWDIVQPNPPCCAPQGYTPWIYMINYFLSGRQTAFKPHNSALHQVSRLSSIPKTRHKLTNPIAVNQNIIWNHLKTFPCVRIEWVRVPGFADIILFSHSLQVYFAPVALTELLAHLLMDFSVLFHISLYVALTMIRHVRLLIPGKRNHPLIIPHPPPTTNGFDHILCDGLSASQKNCCRNYKPDCQSK